MLGGVHLALRGFHFGAVPFLFNITSWVSSPFRCDLLLSEIAVKPVAITRKNSLFSDSVAGAVASAIIFSIINTAAANNLDTYKYLEFIFRRLPNIPSLDDSILDEYLPWSEEVQLKCRSKSRETDVEKKVEQINESA